MKGIPVQVKLLLASGLLVLCSVVDGYSQGEPLSDSARHVIAQKVVWVYLMNEELDRLIANQIASNGRREEAWTIEGYEKLVELPSHESITLQKDTTVVAGECKLDIYVYFYPDMLHHRWLSLAIRPDGTPYRLNGFAVSDVDSLVMQCFGGVHIRNARDLAFFFKRYVSQDRGSIIIKTAEDVATYRDVYSELSIPDVDFDEMSVTYYSIYLGEHVNVVTLNRFGRNTEGEIEQFSIDVKVKEHD